MSALPVFPAQGPWFAEWCGKFWDIQISPGLYAPSFAAVHCNPHIGMTAEDARTAARLIAAAPDHALVCWAMCVGAGRWEPLGSGGGEFCIHGIRHVTTLDEFGCPVLTDLLRAEIAAAKEGRPHG